jgi:hypothetical protein
MINILKVFVTLFFSGDKIYALYYLLPRTTMTAGTFIETVPKKLIPIRKSTIPTTMELIL